MLLPVVCIYIAAPGYGSLCDCIQKRGVSHLKACPHQRPHYPALICAPFGPFAAFGRVYCLHCLFEIHTNVSAAHLRPTDTILSKVILDTGSHDMWLALSTSLPHYTNPSLTATIDYGEGTDTASSVSGPVLIAEMQFANFTVPSQAFSKPCSVCIRGFALTVLLCGSCDQ